MGLIQQMFNVNILFKKLGSYSEENIGIPEGNPLSPLLANMYLHKLDEFIIKRQDENWNKSDVKKYSSTITKE